MTQDSRQSGRPHSGTVDIPSGDGSLFVALNLRDEEMLSLNEIRLDYSHDATVNTVVEVHDNPDSTNNGNEDELVDKFHLAPGDTVNPDMDYSDIEDDVLVTADGTQDGELTVTVGGYKITG